MSNIFKIKLGAKTGSETISSTTAATPINAKQFLGIEEGQSYSTSEFIPKFGLSLRDAEAQQFEQAIDYTQKGYPIVGALITRMDKGNRPYVMANFEVRRGVAVPLKVIVEGNILQFLKDYQEGRITINFSLAELIEVAMNV